MYMKGCSVMRIGLVGSDIWLNKFEKEICADFPDIIFIPFGYSDLLTLPDLLNGEQTQCDLLLFFGETARRWTEKQVKPVIPWYSIPRSSSAFLGILARAAMDGYGPSFITDYQNPSYFKRAMLEADIPPGKSQITYISYGTFTAEEYMTQNAALMIKEFQKGKASFCATIFLDTYMILKEKNIPVFYLMPSFEDIRHTIQTIMTSSKMENINSNKIAVMSISIDPIDVQHLTVPNIPHLNQEKFTIAEYINNFSYAIKAALIPSGNNTFTLIATDEALQIATHQMTTLDLLRQVEESTGLSLSIGVGLSENILEARIRSQKALQYAMANGGNCGFCVGDKECVIGPIRSGIAAPIRESTNHLLKLAKLANINYEYLRIMSDLCQKEHRNVFTPGELADASGIRRRTMNRILLKLIDIGCCIEAGINCPKQRGRPSRIIELHLEQQPSLLKK